MKKARRTPEETRVEFIAFLSFMMAFFVFVALVYLNLTPILFLHSLFGPIGFYAGHIISIFFLHIVVSLVLALGFHFSRKQLKMLAKILLLIDVALPLSLILLSALGFYVIETTGAFFLVVLLTLAFIGLVGLVSKLYRKRFLEWIRIEYASNTRTRERRKTQPRYAAQTGETTTCV